MEYLFMYRGLVFVVIGGVLYLVISGAQGVALLKQALLGYMLRAEKAARAGASLGFVTPGELMEAVVRLTMTQIVPRLPAWLRPFITELLVRQWAQRLYDWARDYLDDGKMNGSLKG